MKALHEHQKKNLKELKEWLGEQLQDCRVVYLESAPMEIQHIPIRALSGIVVDYNCKHGTDFVVGGENTYDIRKTAVYERHIFDLDEDDEYYTKLMRGEDVGTLKP